MKTVLITGANRGIGLEFARQYAAEGWHVLACARHPEKAGELQTLASQHPERMKIHTLDVADHRQIDELGRSLSGESIDLLLNNAGIYAEAHRSGIFRSEDYEAWMRTFLINTMATLKMAQTFASQIARSSQKKIVTISSKMGSIEDNDGGGSYMYRSSKAAVNMVVKSLSIDLKQAGVIAVVLHPGWVKTDMGGPNALISPVQSVSGMRQVIDRLTLKDSGSFIEYDGKLVPW
ncbi:NAD(P)-dependent dehydrogenase, short-chain alcohol dehydrogenase family [Nitrosospira multiformis]|uniref:NAD(P)-dependent dehydrogenase, short-chain alcohol dehydrogenase family n=1 Tax=Nitrosospira multiformis TaxID=1231 RepID=A0A1H8JMT2_9PROT|nr:SDR family oxidoreductase [Nitrosospira multiformis]SEN81617.1 NAD(P)-dependent dehydrogenase, short-chain alcohol dehydrogenase family [Nitrosospira multiformis]